jgi:methylenetetrahydrofolate reductase (NADPH)
MINDLPYVMEILTPRPGAGGEKEALGKFEVKYRGIIESGCAVSVPDNPLGNPRLQALDAVESLGLSVDPGKFIMNLNTFHAKDDLDRILRRAADAGVRYLLVVRGDGSHSLPKLKPEDIGAGLRGGTGSRPRGGVVASVELLAYIHREFPGRFVTGVAFNQYKPASVERSRLMEKIDSGAGFIVTQPVIGADPSVAALSELRLPVVVEAWMSKNVELLRRSVKAQIPPGVLGPREEGPSKPGSAEYDPIENLRVLHRGFPGRTVYLSMLDFGGDWRAALPRLGGKNTESRGAFDGPN